MATREAVSGAERPAPISAGSKKYVAASVATTFTACPAAVSASNSAGTRTAATLPVTPSSTLAIARLLQITVFESQYKPIWQLASRHALILFAHRPDVSPMGSPVERVRYHQVRVRLLS